MVAPVGYPDHHGHKEADSAYVVHKRREKGSQTGQRRYSNGQVVGDARVPTGYHVDDAGIVEGAAQDQNGGHGYHRRMSESLERLPMRHDAHDCQDEKGQQSNDIVTPLSRYEQDQGENEDAEDYSLIHQSNAYLPVTLVGENVVTFHFHLAKYTGHYGMLD